MVKVHLERVALILAATADPVAADQGVLMGLRQQEVQHFRLRVATLAAAVAVLNFLLKTGRALVALFVSYGVTLRSHEHSLLLTQEMCDGTVLVQRCIPNRTT